MKSRILTALILFPPVIYLIGWSPRWLFVVAVILTAGLALYEYFGICLQSGFKTLPAVGYAGAAGVILAQAGTFLGARNLLLAFLTLLVLVTMSVAIFGIEDPKQYLTAMAATLLGVLYIALPLSFLVPLRFRNGAQGANLILLLFLVIWAGDIFAYFVGRAVGRHLLFPRVSPKKTLEGSLAGFAGSLLAAWGFVLWVWKTADLKSVILLAALVAIAGQVGDFVESAMKRGAGLKDSGTILPGHGGMLDRIDALLFGTAALWVALSIKDFWVQ